MHRRSYDQGVSVKRGLCQGVPCPGGRSVSGGEGSVSRGVSVQGSLFRGVSVQGGLCPEGLCNRDPRTIKTGRYASYWNAFLFCMFFVTK